MRELVEPLVLAVSLIVAFGARNRRLSVMTRLYCSGTPSLSAIGGAPPTRARGSVPSEAAVPVVAGGSGTGEAAVVADILAVALCAGAPVRQAVIDTALRRRGSDPRSRIAAAGEALERGEDLVTVLEELAASEPCWHPLATQLLICAQSGTPGAAALRQLASSERLRLRRLRERRARRLPVLLLLPLVTMVLPAFLLVTVVPFVASGGLSLHLPPDPGDTDVSSEIREPVSPAPPTLGGD